MTNRHGRWVSLPRPLPPGRKEGKRGSSEAAREASTRVAARVERKEGKGSVRVAALTYRSWVPARHPNSSGIESGPGGSAELGSPGGQRETLPFYPQENTPVPARPGYLTPSHNFGGPELQDFEVLSVLGQGSYGTVRKVCSRVNGRVYALKSAKAGQRSQEEQGILELARSIKSPFVVRLHRAYEECERKHLLLDYVEGQDLARCLQQCRPWAFSEGSVRFVMAELCMALQALHGMGIVHRDIKAGNVVLGADGHVVLVDFNCAVQGLKEAREVYLSPNSLQAPETVQKHVQGAEVDWWCMGIMVHELLLGYLPWNHLVRGGSACETELLRRIVHCDVPLPCYGVPAQARDLMQGLLCRDPHQRLGAQGAEQVMAHPFFASVEWERLSRKEAVFFEDAEWERLARKEAVPEALLPQQQITGIEMRGETDGMQELLADVDAVYMAERKSLRREFAEVAEARLVELEEMLTQATDRGALLQARVEAAEERAQAAEQEEQAWQRANRTVSDMWKTEQTRAETAEKSATDSGRLLGMLSESFSRVVEENAFLRAQLGLPPK